MMNRPGRDAGRVTRGCSSSSCFRGGRAAFPVVSSIDESLSIELEVYMSHLEAIQKTVVNPKEQVF